MHRRARGSGARRQRDERGTTVVESAIVLPVLVVLLFGIIEFGFAYNDYLALRSAAREGARLAAVNNGCVGGAAAACGNADAQRDDLLADTLKKANGVSASPNGISISVWRPGTNAVGQDVAVSLSSPMKSRTGLFAPFINPITLKATAKMRIEQAGTFTAGNACNDVTGTSGGVGPAPAC